MIKGAVTYDITGTVLLIGCTLHIPYDTCNLTWGGGGGGGGLTYPLIVVAKVFVKPKTVLKALALFKMFYDNVVKSAFSLPNPLPRQSLELFHERDV